MAMRRTRKGLLLAALALACPSLDGPLSSSSSSSSSSPSLVVAASDFTQVRYTSNLRRQEQLASTNQKRRLKSDKSEKNKKSEKSESNTHHNPSEQVSTKSPKHNKSSDSPSASKTNKSSGKVGKKSAHSSMPVVHPPSTESADADSKSATAGASKGGNDKSATNDGNNGGDSDSNRPVTDKKSKDEADTVKEEDRLVQEPITTTTPTATTRDAGANESKGDPTYDVNLDEENIPDTTRSYVDEDNIPDTTRSSADDNDGSTDSDSDADTDVDADSNADVDADADEDNVVTTSSDTNGDTDSDEDDNPTCDKCTCPCVPTNTTDPDNGAEELNVRIRFNLDASAIRFPAGNVPGGSVLLNTAGFDVLPLELPDNLTEVSVRITGACTIIDTEETVTSADENPVSVCTFSVELDDNDSGFFTRVSVSGLINHEAFQGSLPVTGSGGALDVRTGDLFIISLSGTGNSQLQALLTLR